MSSSTPDSVRAEIIENSTVMGNPVKTALLALLNLGAPKGIYADSNSLLANAAPFPLVVSGSEATTTAVADIRGASTLSATGPLTNTFVAGSAVTTFTTSGYARVLITDSAGNITNSNYYIQFGTIS